MSQWVERARQRVATSLSVENGTISTRWVAIVAFASLIVLLLTMNMELNLYDEAIILQGAVEVLRGSVPHRDFFWTYGPMQAWVVAGLFATFGKALIVARLYDVLIRAGVVLLCGLMARRLGLPSLIVIAVMLIETLLIAMSGFYLYPVLPSVLCALAGTLLLTGRKLGAEVSRGRLLVAGMLTGLTALFRYDIGFFLLTAHLASLALFCIIARTSIRVLFGQFVTYGLGISFIFLPVAIGAWWAGAVPAFIHDIISFPPINYARMRGLPWPMPGASLYSLLPLISYLPFLIAALGIAWLISVFRHGSRKTNFSPQEKLALALLCLAIFFVLKGLVRMSLIHSLLALIPALVLLPFLLTQERAKRLQVAVAAGVALSLLLILLNGRETLLLEAQRGYQRLLAARVTSDVPAAPPSASCTTSERLGVGFVDEDTYRASCDLASRTRPGDYVYVGAGRHDKIFAGNVALYYLSDRRPATHWYHLEPGLQTKASVQREMIRDLIAKDVRVVAADTRFDKVAEPNDSARSSGVHLLDEFIARRYSEVARFGSIIIFERR